MHPRKDPARALAEPTAAVHPLASQDEIATAPDLDLEEITSGAPVILPEVAQDAPGGEGVRWPTDTIGVGPWEGEWPTEPHFDPEYLRLGDRRNVVDKYRYWSMQAIITDLDLHRHDFHVAIENWEHDLNIGTVVRTANAFMAKAVHIVGRRRWNRRGAMVTDRYQHVYHHATPEDLVAWAAEQDLVILGIDNLPGSVPLETYELPRRCILLFGQEGPGLSEAARVASRDVLSIAQFGSTRSLNAASAAAIAMHSWVQKHATIPQ